MQNDRPALHCGKVQQVRAETTKRSCAGWKYEPRAVWIIRSSRFPGPGRHTFLGHFLVGIAKNSVMPLSLFTPCFDSFVSTQ